MRIRHVLYLIFGPLLLLSFVLLLGLSWLMAEPRSIDYVSNKLRAELVRVAPESDIDFSELHIEWQGFEKRFVFRVDDVSVGQEGEEIAIIPSVFINIQLLPLILEKRVSIAQITISDASFVLDSTSEDGGEGGFDYAGFTRYLLDSVAEQPMLPLRELALENVRIDVRQKDYQGGFTIQYANINAGLEGGDIAVLVDGQIRRGSVISAIGVKWLLEETQEATLNVTASDIKVGLISDLVPAMWWLRDSPQISNVRFDASFDQSGIPRSGTYSIKSPDFPGYTVPARVVLNDRQIAISGAFEVHESIGERSNVPEIWASGTGYHLPIDDLHHYWPPFYETKERAWVLDHIHEGNVAKATLSVHVRPENIIEGRPREGTVETTMQVTGVNMSYFRDMLPLEDASGTVVIDWNSLKATDIVGKAGDSSLSEGAFEITSFSSKIAPISYDIKGRVDGAAKDVLSFFDFNPSADEEAQGGADALDIQGDATGEFALKFPAKEQLQLDDLKLESHIEFSGVEIADMWRGQPATSDAISLKTTDRMVVIGGQVTVGDMQLDATLSQEISNTPKEPRTLKLYGEVPVQSVSPLEGVFGEVTLNTTIAMLGNEHHMEVAIEGEEVRVDLPLVVAKRGKRYPVSYEASLVRNLQTEEVAINESKLVSSGEEYDISGTVKGGGESIYIDMVAHPSSRHDASLTYEHTAEGQTHITASGKKLHIGNLLRWSNEQGTASDPLWKQDMTIQARLNELHLMDDVKMNNVSFSFECSDDYCTEIRLTGKLADKPLYLSFAPQDDDNPAGINVFELDAGNAGALFKGVGVTNSVREGMLHVYAVGSFERPAQGTIEMTDFIVKDAPVLGRLLTLGSLRAMSDFLTGEGMHFSTLNSEFTYADGKATIKDMRARGSAMGMTASGMLDLDNSKIDITGTLAPSYGLNTLVEKIPLVGNLLSGGEGKGLIASRYRIQGDASDPKVTVNPLSMLTPGLLRDLWPEAADVKQKAEPTKEVPEAQQPKVEEPQVEEGTPSSP